MSTEPGELGPRGQRLARVGCVLIGLTALLLGAGLGAASSYVLQGSKVREAEGGALRAEEELQRQRCEIQILQARAQAAYWERRDGDDRSSLLERTVGDATDRYGKLVNEASLVRERKKTPAPRAQQHR